MTLRIENLKVGYRHRTVLEGLSPRPVAPATLVGVIGRNGAGKSTLLKTIAGLLPGQGLVHFGDRPLDATQRARTLGYLPQSLPQPSSLLAYETVYSACRAAHGGLDKEQLEQNMESVFSRLGIRELALRRLDQLSGGQRQMIGLAQVLVRQPRLLLLDEPTSALDLHWQLNVLQCVQQFSRELGTLSLVAIHDINLALRFCDELWVLAGGGLLAQGPARDLLTPAVLRTAYGVEARVERCSLGLPMVLCDSAMPAYQP
ncbi:ABC transporter ATP-binding protein [Zobellella iuensis]|uniref:ABC transporter ATP-binding protein n=1 Tax=Zobellella iuensis TaxID=2803811 RepID=A0ABS1QW31_9GAMM|nr:ABC transporter ATP-binding protein [Zobellella iuensis]MBL1379088.1 ABC transporter ATP-binding protein [Zobellella iuensis]